MREPDWPGWIMLIGVIIWLAFWGSIIWIAWHFISKWW